MFQICGGGTIMNRFIFVFLLLCNIITAGENTLLLVGAEAPPFVLPTLTGTREYLRTWCGETLAKPFLNKIPRRVILSFWSTTCLPCMKEIPGLHSFVSKHEQDSLKVFLVNLDNQTSSELQAFVTSKGWTFPVLVDPYQSVAKRYAVTALPTVYVISPEGKIEHAFTGIPEGVSPEQFFEQKLYPKLIAEVKKK